MTTIAWKNGVIAADMRGTSDNVLVSSDMQKLVPYEVMKNGIMTRGVMTGTGIWSIIYRYRDEMMKATDRKQAFIDIVTSDEYREYWAEQEMNMAQMFFFEEGSVMRFSFLAGFEEYNADCYAVGSGCEFALGAMSAGASAIEAVKIASMHDTATGPHVQTVPFPGWRPGSSILPDTN